MAMRKLAKILRSKLSHDVTMYVSYLVDVLVRLYMQKRGKWSTARSVFSFNRTA